MNLEPLIFGLISIYGEFIHEIIPVDDNSTDETRQVMLRLAATDARVRPVFRTPPNGVGRALADGYRASTGAWILSMDCDFQHLLPELRDVFEAATEDVDVVVGSRFSRHSVLLNYPFQKIVANRGFHALAQTLLRRRFRDLTNNLKLMRRHVVARLRLVEPGFAANAETGLEPLLMGSRVVEVPISWINRTPDMGSSSFRLAQVGGGYWRVLRRLLRRLALDGGPYADLRVASERTSSRTWWRGDAPPPSPFSGTTNDRRPVGQAAQRSRPQYQPPVLARGERSLVDQAQFLTIGERQLSLLGRILDAGGVLTMTSPPDDARYVEFENTVGDYLWLACRGFVRVSTQPDYRNPERAFYLAVIELRDSGRQLVEEADQVG
jgi:hypothetical protein